MAGALELDEAIGNASTAEFDETRVSAAQSCCVPVQWLRTPGDAHRWSLEGHHDAAVWTADTRTRRARDPRPRRPENGTQAGQASRAAPISRHGCGSTSSSKSVTRGPCALERTWHGRRLQRVARWRDHGHGPDPMFVLRHETGWTANEGSVADFAGGGDMGSSFAAERSGRLCAMRISSRSGSVSTFGSTFETVASRSECAFATRPPAKLRVRIDSARKRPAIGTSRHTSAPRPYATRVGRSR